MVPYLVFRRRCTLAQDWWYVHADAARLSLGFSGAEPQSVALKRRVLPDCLSQLWGVQKGRRPTYAVPLSADHA